MWEHWDSDEQVGSGMNSLNHSPFTFIPEFFDTILAAADEKTIVVDVGAGDYRFVVEQHD